KPITAGAIQYYTGKYHPTKQNNSKRGFAFVTLGAGIDDFTEPARDMEQHLTETISNSMFWITIFLGFTFLVMIVLLILMTIAISTYITDNIDILITGFSIFRSGCRRFRLRTNTSDEFGILANSFDEMADSIVNSQSGFVTIIDLEFKILYASDDSLLIWNISSSDTDGKSYHSVSIYPQNSKYDPILALAEGRESDIIYIAGANRYYKGQANYLLDEKSNKIGYIIITHDVSEIEDARIKAEQANIAKTTFLANMSHEIRTPMNSIMGVTEILMLNESLSHDTIDKLERIHNSCQLLLGIINDILDLSKIEAGKMDLFCSEYPIDMMIYSTAQLNIFRIQGKPIQFTLKVDENLPSHLIGDEIRIKQILNNILSNALKYTEKGFVTLSITAEPGKDPDDMILVFGTKDTGLGMTEEQLNRLFDPYSRFASNITKTIEGTGLGLFITNQLIRLMNGTIEVESQPGVGTNVVIKLPQKISKNQVIGTELAKHIEDFQFRDTSMNKKAKVQRVPMPYAKVLVVDDITTNLYVAKGLLAPYKMTIETVDSGIAAVDKIASGNIYDLILMDHMMPEMDGIEATKIIRELGYKKPIIALTANAVIGQADIFMQNGFDAFISKPIDVVSLDNNLMIWIRNKQNEDTLQKAEAGRTKSSDSSEGSNFELDPEMVQAFLSDAKASLITLKETIEKDNLKLFTITIHGMKSALAIIGQKEISQKASDLEEAGLKENTDFLSNHVDEFIRDLENIISDISKTVNEDDTIEPIEEDTNLLIAELQKIKAECETLNDEAIFSIIDMLQKQQWKKNTLQFINDIHNSIHLHSDFDTVIEMIDKKLQESL
ncbi:MAG: ATP-binding protein, partial [Candidatus Cloacimonetes bacterium]|nr:ATP-binding protein [Candidatus Cloacimonadota bacterium]